MPRGLRRRSDLAGIQPARHAGAGVRLGLRHAAAPAPAGLACAVEQARTVRGFWPARSDARHQVALPACAVIDGFRLSQLQPHAALSLGGITIAIDKSGGSSFLKSKRDTDFQTGREGIACANLQPSSL